MSENPNPIFICDSIFDPRWPNAPYIHKDKKPNKKEFSKDTQAAHLDAKGEGEALTVPLVLAR